MEKKNTLTINRLVIFLILSLYVFGIMAYPRLPARVPSRWNLSGEVEGYTSKLAHVVVLPTIILGLYLLMALAPKIDPKPKSYKKFNKVFEGFRLILVLVLGLTYIATSLVALGYDIAMHKVVLVTLGTMIIYLGNYFGKVRHNYTFGIKTPWTLASEEVWNKTHRASAPLWVITGIIWVLSALLSPRLAFVLDMSILFLVTIYSSLYSYILFRRLS